MSNIEVSIIIVHYNTPELLIGCLDSIYKYTQDINFEVIVVDNDSFKKPILDNLRYENFSWLQSKRNAGFAVANNMGVAEAKGEFVWLLNSDTQLIEDSLKMLLDFANRTEKLGILGAKLLNMDRTIQQYGSVLGRKQFSATVPVETSFLSGAAMLMKRSIFESVNGFDENYFFYNEDIDLCKTLLKAGYKVIYFPLTGIVHFGGKSTKKSLNLRQQAMKSSWYLFKKHYLKK